MGCWLVGYWHILRESSYTFLDARALARVVGCYACNFLCSKFVLGRSK